MTKPDPTRCPPPPPPSSTSRHPNPPRTTHCPNAPFRTRPPRGTRYKWGGARRAVGGRHSQFNAGRPTRRPDLRGYAQDNACVWSTISGTIQDTGGETSVSLSLPLKEDRRVGDYDSTLGVTHVQPRNTQHVTTARPPPGIL